MAHSSLHDLLVERRGELLTRWQNSVRSDVTAIDMADAELIDSMPVFMDHLLSALQPAEVGENESATGTRLSARVHGSERLRLGFDVTAVVREYNLLERAILEIAEANRLPLEASEIRLLVNIIGDAQADAVAEYQRKRDSEQARQASEHLAFLAHELRNPLSSTMTAFAMGRIHMSPDGSKYWSAMDRGLRKLMDLLDHALVAGRVQAGVLIKSEPVDLAAIARELASESIAEAEHRRVTVDVDAPGDLLLDGEARLLRSVLSNLIGNAIKFSKPDTTVFVRAHRAHSTAVVEIEDRCGGLPPDKVTAIFDPHVQIGSNRSGFGLGLAIAKQAAEAHGGTLQIQNLTGKGCCFRLELPLSAS